MGIWRTAYSVRGSLCAALIAGGVGFVVVGESHLPDLNWEPPVYKTGALPIELRWRGAVILVYRRKRPALRAAAKRIAKFGRVFSTLLHDLEDFEFHCAAWSFDFDGVADAGFHQSVAHWTAD